MDRRGFLKLLAGTMAAPAAFTLMGGGTSENEPEAPKPSEKMEFGPVEDPNWATTSAWATTVAHFTTHSNY